MRVDQSPVSATPLLWHSTCCSPACDSNQKYAMARPQAATASQMPIEARPATLAAAGIAAPADRRSTARAVQTCRVVAAPAVVSQGGTRQQRKSGTNKNGSHDGCLRICGRREYNDSWPRCAQAARGLRDALSDHPGNTTRFAQRTGNAVLEIADRRSRDITGPHIGPGTAGRLGFAGDLATPAVGIRRRIELPKIASEPIEAELDCPGPWLDDPGPAHSRYAARRCDPWRHPGLQPADGAGTFGHGIGKSPGTTAGLAFATRGA
jgi:hypothetical protein